MRKQLNHIDLENPDACIFVGFDGVQWYCETFADYLYTQNKDNERYFESLQPMFEELEELEELEKLEELERIQDKLEKK